MTPTETSTTLSLLKNLQFTDPTGYTHLQHLEGYMSELASLPVFQILERLGWMAPPPHHYPAWNIRSHLWLLLSPYSKSNWLSYQLILFPIISLSTLSSSSYSMSFLVQAHIISCPNYVWACKLVSLPLVPSSLTLKLSSLATPNLSSNTSHTGMTCMSQVLSSPHLHVPLPRTLYLLPLNLLNFYISFKTQISHHLNFLQEFPPGNSSWYTPHPPGVRFPTSIYWWCPNILPSI